MSHDAGIGIAGKYVLIIPSISFRMSSISDFSVPFILSTVNAIAPLGARGFSSSPSLYNFVALNLSSSVLCICEISALSILSLYVPKSRAPLDATDSDVDPEIACECELKQAILARHW